MKWLFIPAAAALSLAVAAPALATPARTANAAAAGNTHPMRLAQVDRRDNNKDNKNQERDRARKPGPAVQAPQRAPRPGVHKPAIQQPVQRQQMQRQQVQKTQRYNWRDYKPGQRPPAWRQHRNLDRGAWMHNYTAQKRYRWRAYQRPPGWFARRWVFGTLLPTIFWTQQYWIDNYWEFGLMDPPYGYVWVRYGDDALLVNVTTGYILQVQYGLFY